MNPFEVVSFCSQYGISKNKSSFFTSNILGGIIKDPSLSKGRVKSQIGL